MSLLPVCPRISATESSDLRIFAIKFLTREGCRLCDEARPLIFSEAERLGIAVEEIDIDQDEDLLVNYGLRIPVVLGPEDRVLAEGAIDEPKALRRALRRARRG